MVQLFGTDLNGAFDAIKGGVGDLMQNLDLSGPQQQAAGGRDPFAGLQVGGNDPFKGLSYGNSSFDNLQLGGDPFAGLGMRLGGTDPNTGYSSLQSFGYSPVFAAFDQASGKVTAQAQADEKARQQAQINTIGSQVNGGSGGYTGTGTASDNAGITGQKVDQFIASKFANSPLIGKGQLILDYANAKGVSVPEAVGIFWKESGMGTTAGPGWNIAGLGGAGNFAQYGNVDDAIRAAIDNLASDQYRGKSVQDHIGYWFVGPQRYAQSGLNADDGTGGRNGTVGDYLNNFIAPTYAALGAQYNPTGTPTRQAATTPGGAGMLAGPWAFPVVGYQGQIATHWGTDETGASDIMAAGGTPIVAMHGGRVVDASYNNYGGNTVTIVDDQGRTYYYAHMQGPALVAAGQTVQAGARLGAVGNTGDAAGGPTHLHLGISAPNTDIKLGNDAHGGAGWAWGNGPQDNAVGLLGWVLNGGGAPTGGGGAGYR